MLLTLTTTHRPATDLGYLLHKHPGRMHEIELAFGSARVFYPEATEDRCTAALLLELDPLQLTRRRRDAAVEQYVNDRPYVVSSFLAVALAKAFGTALGGRSKERQELAGTAIPLRAEMPTLPARGGPDLVRRLFEPLGYRVETTARPLDPRFPEWGDSPCLGVVLESERRLAELLGHLYVLIPVLDDRKHYWIEEKEIDKLLARGEGWLAEHPERDLIVNRYLRRQQRLARQALSRLVPVEEDEEDGLAAVVPSDEEERGLEAPLRLHDLRLEAVREELERLGARSVLDLGCGDGKLLQRLVRSRGIEQVTGLEVSLQALEAARRRLRLEEASPKLLERVTLLHGGLTYRDARLEGFDAAALVEVIEHLEPSRLSALEQVVWHHARPRALVLTTPNREYNARFPGLSGGRLRHRDHRFEWTRRELEDWAGGVAARRGYRVRFAGVGEVDPELGPPTLMAVFERCD